MISEVGHEKTRLREQTSFVLADGVGFEPTRRGCRLLVFKTSSFGRSDNHPNMCKALLTMVHKAVNKTKWWPLCPCSR